MSPRRIAARAELAGEEGRHRLDLYRSPIKGERRRRDMDRRPMDQVVTGCQLINQCSDRGIGELVVVGRVMGPDGIACRESTCRRTSS